jgi:hypothetical protein
VTTDRAVDVGLTIAPTGGDEDLRSFADRLAKDVEKPLKQATGREWCFRTTEDVKLQGDQKQTGADFLVQASLRLAENELDLMVVVTDAPLLSHKRRIVSGVASPLTRICVVSTRQLRKRENGSDKPLNAASVRWNAATLLLNLIGRVLGARETRTGAMARFDEKPERKKIEPYVPPEQIRALADRLIEPAYPVHGPISTLWAHIRSIFFDPMLLLQALARNRALLLPLKLSGLAAAAVAPVFVLVFTAEMWDAGLHMANRTAEIYSALTIGAATLYLTFALRLFLPRKETARLPRHLALANVVIFTTVLLGMIGLYLMLILFSLALEDLVMPHALAYTLPTLRIAHAHLGDKLRLAGFISAVGVTTGALAGGLQGRDVLQQLALFESAA